MARTRQIFDFHARQGRARPAQAGGREISAISSPAFVHLRLVGDDLDSRREGPIPFSRYKNNYESCHHTKVLVNWSVRLKSYFCHEAQSLKLHVLQRASCRFVLIKTMYCILHGTFMNKSFLSNKCWKHCNTKFGSARELCKWMI